MRIVEFGGNKKVMIIVIKKVNKKLNKIIEEN